MLIHMNQKILDIEADSLSPEMASGFYYDKEWLAITRAAYPYLSTSMHQTSFDLVNLQTCVFLNLLIFREIEASRRWLDENVEDFKIPCNFQMTAPPQAYFTNPSLLSIIACK